MSRLLIHLGKASFQPFGATVSMTGANLAVASSAVVGMELSGFDAASFFSPVDSVALQQQMMDSYAKLALSSQEAPLVEGVESRVDSLVGLMPTALFPASSVFVSDGLGRVHPSMTNALFNEIANQEPQAGEDAELGDAVEFQDSTSSIRGEERQESAGKAAGETAAVDVIRPLSKDAATSGGAEANQGPSKQVFVSRGRFETLQGSAFDDTLIGSYDADTLIGLAGNDSYFIYSTGSQLVESQGAGYDSVFVGVESYRTEAEVELIQVWNSTEYQDHTNGPDVLLKNLDAGWHIEGNAYAQTLIGGQQHDVLDGMGGQDTLIGGLGNDVYSYTGVERIIEVANQGYDTVRASASLALPSHIDAAVTNAGAQFVNLTGNDLSNLLIGASDANVLSGGLGDDTLVGCGGEDVYSGGFGADTFVLNGQEAFVGEIQDYEVDIDQIVFSLSANLQPNQLTFSDSEFHGVAGELLLLDGMIQADWDGDAISDVLLLINGLASSADIAVFDPRDLPGF